MFVSKDLKLPYDSFPKAMCKGHIQFMGPCTKGFILGDSQIQIKRDTSNLKVIKALLQALIFSHKYKYFFLNIDCTLINWSPVLH